MTSLTAIDLGATLYVPATRGDLLAVVLGQKIAHLHSVVVCLEDSVSADDVPAAEAGLAKLLSQLALHPQKPDGPTRPILLVRPRDSAMAKRLFQLNNSRAVQGWVLPKVTADKLPAWLRALPERGQYILPTLETREVFDASEMKKLRAQLLTIRDRVLCLRIGGNDLLQLLGARRSRARTAYAGPLGAVITSVVSQFSPWGFELSAPVLEDFTNQELLREEVERDLEYGLMTKTAIHPAQLQTILAAYAVHPHEAEEARHILAEGAKAVFAEHGAMAEPATHKRWAERTLLRQRVYGLRQEEQAMLAQTASAA